MIKTFLQPIDFSTINTQSRDKTALDNQVNQFIQSSSKVIPIAVRSSVFTDQSSLEGTQYAMAVLEYNIKQG